MDTGNLAVVQSSLNFCRSIQFKFALLVIHGPGTSRKFDRVILAAMLMSVSVFVHDNDPTFQQCHIPATSPPRKEHHAFDFDSTRPPKKVVD